MQNSGFDESIGIARFTMDVTGIWPGVELNPHWYSRYHFLVPIFFMFFFIIIPQTRMLMLAWGDTNTVLEILVTADIVTGLACLKLLGIWCNKRDLRNLLIKMKEDWKIVETDRQKIMWKHAKRCKLIVNSYIPLTIAVILAHALRMLVILNLDNSSGEYERNAENFSRSKPMFYISEFFFETHSSPTFEIIWMGQFAASLLAIAAFSSFDGFFIFSTLHLCSQLVILQLDLRKLTCQCQLTKLTFAQSLGLIVKRHLDLQRFSNSIEESFNKVFLVQMISYSITLCLQGYQLVINLTEQSKNTVANLTFFAVFATANITSLFVYCFIAEKLRTESTNIFFVIYEANWYELKPKEAIMLLNIMFIAKTPLEMTTGKFSALSFEYFTAVMKTSAGYLSMLLAVKNRL